MCIKPRPVRPYLRTFREGFVEKVQPQLNIEATTVEDRQMARETSEISSFSHMNK